ncbi:MAG: hypothetical protein J3Q66DRAFT_137586 [Benniella sp.]|nr:MAG: hypothetical protein J3Q66DRAFT_137586 [Benniella sp.]
MQGNAQDRVFAIPELVNLITQYLSPRDISQWIMSCKTFSRQLEPFFWSHPVLGSCHQHPKFLVRYAPHFLSLEARPNTRFSFMQRASPPLQITSNTLAALPEFPRLRKFTIHAQESNAFLLLYSHLVLHSPNLTELNLQYDFKSDSLSMKHYLNAMATTLPCLQRLTIKYKSKDPTTGFHLLEVCFAHPQLTDLQCDFTMEDDLFPAINKRGTYDPRFAALLKSLQDKGKAKANDGQPTGLRLKSLSLPTVHKGYPKAFMIPFLESHVPNLERLSIPKVHKLDNEADVRRLEKAIEIGCPQLQHLSSNWKDAGIDDEEIDKGWNSFISVLRGCAKAGLRTYQSRCFFDDRYSQGSIIESLLHYHGEAMEEIEFLDCYGISSESIQSILSTCKGLRKLRVESCADVSCDLRVGDVLKEWVCLDITVLNLRLQRQVDVLECSRTKDEVMADAAQRVYSQIGRLVKLEDLTLTIYEDDNLWDNLEESCAYDLTLERGWLGELAGLKRLRRFRMNHNYWGLMGQSEVEFIDTNWLELQSITFYGYTFRYGDQLQMDHWKWLKERRPYINLVVQ